MVNVPGDQVSCRSDDIDISRGDMIRRPRNLPNRPLGFICVHLATCDSLDTVCAQLRYRTDFSNAACGDPQCVPFLPRSQHGDWVANGASTTSPTGPGCELAEPDSCLVFRQDAAVLGVGHPPSARANTASADRRLAGRNPRPERGGLRRGQRAQRNCSSSMAGSTSTFTTSPPTLSRPSPRSTASWAPSSDHPTPGGRYALIGAVSLSLGEFDASQMIRKQLTVLGSLSVNVEGRAVVVLPLNACDTDRSVVVAADAAPP
jgi:hypothetical protein